MRLGMVAAVDVRDHSCQRPCGHVSVRACLHASRGWHCQVTKKVQRTETKLSLRCC